MFSRTSTAALRSSRLVLNRTQRLGRKYNGASSSGPHTTYFQPPPKPVKPRWRILRSILLGSSAFVAGFLVNSYLFEVLIEEELGLDAPAEVASVIPPNETPGLAAHNEGFAKHAVPLGLEAATGFLSAGASVTPAPGALVHGCQAAANLPCEDGQTSAVFGFDDAGKPRLVVLGLYDGHAGSQMSFFLSNFLGPVVNKYLMDRGALDRPYVPNDEYIHRSIQDAFEDFDAQMIQETADFLRTGSLRRAETVSALSRISAGSCALVALFDTHTSVLRVANTGDSRAVLGRWDEAAGKYVAVPLSVDQTGFNQAEVERLQREHPGEDVIDPATGRLFGLAVTRAFGDARWKFTEELSRLAHEGFWAPPPRPNGVIKTPPYLTARPEIMEARVQTDGAKPDFLIMATDGLWDHLSSEDAVTCVQMWLDKHNPSPFLTEHQGAPGDDLVHPLNEGDILPSGSATPPSPGTEEEDTFYDPVEKVLKWKTSPKHLVVTRHHNSAANLIRNAFGGNRVELFNAIMTLPIPRARDARDDVSVQVLFFGVDEQKFLDAAFPGEPTPSGPQQRTVMVPP